MKRGLGRPKKVLTGKRGRPQKLFNMIEVNEEGVEPEEEENHENEELHDRVWRPADSFRSSI
jgi:hypothetical protein